MRRLIPLLVLPVALGLLGACEKNPMAKYKPTYSQLYTTGWELGAGADELNTGPVYCYDSIGRAECYPAPLEDERSRRIVGYEGAPPPPYEPIR